MNNHKAYMLQAKITTKIGKAVMMKRYNWASILYARLERIKEARKQSLAAPSNLIQLKLPKITCI